MTVMKRSVNNSSQDRSSYGSELHRKASVFSSDGKFVGKLKACGGEIETDQESTGSSEDMESPRSVAKVRIWPAKNVNVMVHSQILRIREEDSHLGEDIGEGLSSKDKVAAGHDVVRHVDVMMFPRTILPASPLGGKTSIKIVH